MAKQQTTKRTRKKVTPKKATEQKVVFEEVVQPSSTPKVEKPKIETKPYVLKKGIQIGDTWKSAGETVMLTEKNRLYFEDNFYI